jgi:hypothetical protein
VKTANAPSDQSFSDYDANLGTKGVGWPTIRHKARP